MRVNPLLLGGWLDVLDDARRLEAGLRALPAACSCGHGSGHLSGTCACCERGERRGCTDCEALVEAMRTKVDELVDASLRFLPVVESMAAQAGSTDSVTDVRRRVYEVDIVFRQITTAAGHYRDGCAASHFADLKTLAIKLLGATQAANAALTTLSDRSFAR